MFNTLLILLSPKYLQIFLSIYNGIIPILQVVGFAKLPLKIKYSVFFLEFSLFSKDFAGRNAVTEWWTNTFIAYYSRNDWSSVFTNYFLITALPASEFMCRIMLAYLVSSSCVLSSNALFVSALLLLIFVSHKISGFHIIFFLAYWL